MVTTQGRQLGTGAPARLLLLLLPVVQAQAVGCAAAGRALTGMPIWRFRSSTASAGGGGQGRAGGEGGEEA